jgi:hypothetical protein
MKWSSGLVNRRISCGSAFLGPEAKAPPFTLWLAASDPTPRRVGAWAKPLPPALDSRLKRRPAGLRTDCRQSSMPLTAVSGIALKGGRTPRVERFDMLVD